MLIKLLALMWFKLMLMLHDNRGFAKVTGPLFSISATGKLSNAIVFFPWKGIHVVRQWLKPANPQSGDQGNRRVMLGGLGRAPKYIQKESQYHTYALGVAVAPQTWISAFVGFIMANYFTSVAGLDAMHDELVATGLLADWNSKAVAIGLTNFDLTYKTMDQSMSPPMQLYCLAKYGYDQYQLDNLKFATAPYTASPTAWDAAAIDLMIADFTPV